MRRSRIFAWTSACVFIGSATAVAEPTFTAGQLGLQLRRALGFDAQTLSALGVDSGAYGSVADAAKNYCDANRGTVEPLLAAVRNARQEVLRAYEDEGDIATKDQALIDAIDALATACSAITSTLDGLLTSEQRTLRARVASNRLLDVSVALLDLTSEQRSALRTAQRTRDQVLRHPTQRQDANAIKTAQEQFETAASATLTGDQETERAQRSAALWEHWKDAQVVDEAQLAQ